MQFVCQFCNRIFDDRVNHCLHLMREHQAYVFCSYCEKQFLWKTDAPHHELKFHILRKYFHCTNCWTIFSSTKALSAHKIDCQGTMLCHTCKRYAPDYACLSLHLEYEKSSSPSLKKRSHRGLSSSPPAQCRRIEELERYEQQQRKTDENNQLIRLKIVNVNVGHVLSQNRTDPPAPKRSRSGDELSSKLPLLDESTQDHLIENRDDKFEAYPLNKPRKSVEILLDDVIERGKYSEDSSLIIKEEVDSQTDSSNDSVVVTSSQNQNSILRSAECLFAEQEIANNSDDTVYFCSLCNFADNELDSMQNHMSEYHKLPVHLRNMFCVPKDAEKLSQDLDCERCLSKQKQIDQFKFLLKNLMNTADDMRNLL